MKITIDTAKFKTLLAHHKKMAVASLNKHPSLSSVYIYYQHNKQLLSIMSSDGDNVLQTDLKVVNVQHVKDFVEFRLSAEKLYSILSTLKAKELIVEIFPSKINLVCGSRNFEINCLSGDFFFTKDFFIPTTNQIVLSFKDFKETFKLATFPSTTSGTQKVYSSVLFGLTNNELKLVCTDGYLLSEQKFKIVNSLAKDFVAPVEPMIRALGVIEEIITVNEKNSTSNTSEFSIYFDDKYLLVKYLSDNLVVSERITLCDFEYPMYSTLIPRTLNMQFLCNIAELQDAVSASTLYERIELDIEEVITLHRDKTFSNKNLLVFAEDSETKISDKLQVKHFGEDCHMMFSSKYLDKILDNISKLGDWIIVGYNQFPGAIIILPCDKNSDIIQNVEGECVFIIMPLSSGDTKYQLNKKNSARKVSNE